MERILLNAFLEKGRMSFEDCISVAWPNPDNGPQDEYNVVKVHVCGLRKKLKPPAKLDTIWGTGWELVGVPGVPVHEEDLPVDYPLTKIERKMLTIFMDGRRHRPEYVFNELYDHRRDYESGKKILDIWICKLRKKLSPDWIIKTYWGRGWRLETKK